MFDIARIIEKYGHEADVLEKTGLDAQVLEAIHDDHAQRSPELEVEADRLAALLRRVSGVHSIKARIKQPEHLVDKILRRKKKFPEREYSLENYQLLVDDLIGLRALHLFKNQWRGIHEYVMSEWDLKEEPTAYYRAGDAPETIEEFRASGCVPEAHPAHYRSVHYVLQVPVSKKRSVTAELQVRTLFEEGWGEVDHLVRYPSNTDNFIINAMSALLNRAAGMADEMNIYLELLKHYVDDSTAQLRQQQQQSEIAQEQLNEARRQLADAVEKAQLGEEQKKDLQKRLAAMGKQMDEVSQQRASGGQSIMELAANLFAPGESGVRLFESFGGNVSPLSEFMPVAKVLDPGYGASASDFLGVLSDAQRPQINPLLIPPVSQAAQAASGDVAGSLPTAPPSAAPSLAFDSQSQDDRKPKRSRNRK